MTHPIGPAGTGPGRVITPLTAEQRVGNYLRQTGARYRLTPKQRRRADHKANRAAARAA